jgi:catechol 2,3-dioxygenase-like lactoylglutathione lyase family enzyme
VTVQLNHTIVQCRDKQRSATFLTEILGLPEPKQFGPFLVVELANGASLDFDETDDDNVHIQHYAFLIGEDDFATGGSSTGPTRSNPSPGRSITTTAAEASTSTTPAGISSRSSPARTAAGANEAGFAGRPSRCRPGR